MNKNLSKEEIEELINEIKNSSRIIICTDNILYFYGKKTSLIFGVDIILENLREMLKQK